MIMRTITQLRADIEENVNQLGKMKARCISENRDPNEDERNSAVETLAKIDELEEILELEMRTQGTLDRLREPEKKPERTPVDTRKDKKEQE